ncbi:MAG: sigma-70 family RNA polymerase sigma factor, partial [Bacteroidales bacterium]|nr:sigma-70 family RNA polymerase sigma factor [Bacteroidales bacterium]
RCRKGERKAQEQLYRQYYRAMYNVSFRLLNNQVEAEDVMQEAFLAAFLKINAYRGSVSFGSWLKRIVINRSIDVLRMRKMKLEERVSEDGTEAEQEAEYDVDEVETAATIQKIREAVNALPDGFRVVISLYYFEGYDHNEIAQILGIHESASRSQLVRAKRRLAEFLNAKKSETN